MRLGDFVALTKPRVMSLVVFTALCGLLSAPGPHNPVVSLVALLCISAGAGAAGALNMWYDADIDAVMTRTAMRPISRGHISRLEALTFGLMLGGFRTGDDLLATTSRRRRCWPAPFSFTSSSTRYG